MYDVFISYRRDGGHEMARLIYEHLRLRGVNCFFDLEELGAGAFNLQLLKNIEVSKNFVLILSPNALDRCSNEDDWVRAEIEHAIKNDKNIIPLMMTGFKWPTVLPESLSKLPLYNGVSVVREYFDASIEKLLGMLVIDRPLAKKAKQPQLDKKDVAHSLLERAFVSLENREWNEANSYAEKALDADPKNAEAYLVKLMAELKVDKRENLKKAAEPFGHKKNYDNIIRYADEALKAEISSYLEHVNLLQAKKQERAYDKAKADMETAKSEIEYKKLAKAFEALGSYLDSSTLAKKCITKANAAVYKRAKDELKSARTPEAYMAASRTFASIPSYRDSKHMAEECTMKSDMLKKIGEGGMFRFSPVTEIEIASGVTSIGEETFSQCKSLSGVKIPEGVVTIGKKAFWCCESIKNIAFPNTLTYIGDSAFASCGLTELVIPDSVERIGASAFQSCANLTGVSLGNGVTEIGKNAFLGCSGLSYFKFGNGITSIADWFFSKSNLRRVEIGSGVRSIGNYAFSECRDLTEVAFSEGLTSIGDLAFSNCSALEDMAFPQTLEVIGSGAFNCCRNLSGIELPANLKVIGADAFFQCEALKNVTVPRGVTSVGARAFCGCKNLLSIYVPNSVDAIGDHALPVSAKVIYDGTRAQWAAIKKGIGADELNVTCIDGSVRKETKSDIAAPARENVGSEKFPGANGSYGSSGRNISNNAYYEKKNEIPKNNFTASPAQNSSSPTAPTKKDDDATPKTQKRGCYIATCVYGSYDVPQVWALRRFRDESLASCFFGRLFIRAYYAVSPTLVKWFGGTRWFKKLWRGALDKIVAKLRSKGFEDTPYDDKEW